MAAPFSILRVLYVFVKRLLCNFYSVARNSKIISPSNFTLISSQTLEKKNRETNFWDDPRRILLMAHSTKRVDSKFPRWCPLAPPPHTSKICKKSFNTTGVKNWVFQTKPSCKSIEWMVHPYEPSVWKPKNLPLWKSVQCWQLWQCCLQNDVSVWEGECQCAKERRKRTNSGT